jgi:ADP-heptose:LPS heptosyltransferase
MTRPQAMRGKYLVRRFPAYGYLTALDWALTLRSRHSPDAPPSEIRTIVVAVGGAIGDAVIATSVIDSIARSRPGLKISVVAPSWSHEILSGHPAILRLHTLDHWHTSRVGSLATRIRRWRETRTQVLGELREARYDAAIDLYPYYPNTAVLMRASGIPVRAGFASGGGAPALTAAQPWVEHPVVHVSLRQLEVAQRVLGPLPAPLRYSLPAIRPDDVRAAEQIIGHLPRYVVIHIGAGDPRKMWAEPRWVELATDLMQSGHPVVMTGAGKSEQETARMIQRSASGILNAVGRTSLGSLRAVIAGADCVVANDSLAGHLAAAENVPVVSIMLGPNEPERWRPLAARSAVLAGVGDDESPTAAEVLTGIRRLVDSRSPA